MDVSKNSGFSPQIIHLFIGVFHYKPIHFGVPLFLETPISFLFIYIYICIFLLVTGRIDSESVRFREITPKESIQRIFHVWNMCRGETNWTWGEWIPIISLYSQRTGCWECLTNDLGLCVGMIRFLRKTSARTRTWKGGKCEACRGRSQDQAAGDGGWRFLAGLGPRFTVRCLAFWKIWRWYLYPKRILQIITSLNMSCASPNVTHIIDTSNVFFDVFCILIRNILSNKRFPQGDFSTPKIHRWEKISQSGETSKILQLPDWAFDTSAWT